MFAGLAMVQSVEPMLDTYTEVQGMWMVDAPLWAVRLMWVVAAVAGVIGALWPSGRWQVVPGRNAGDDARTVGFTVIALALSIKTGTWLSSWVADLMTGYPPGHPHALAWALSWGLLTGILFWVAGWRDPIPGGKRE